MIRKQTTRLLVLLLGMMILVAPGCQTWGNKSGATAWWKKSKEPASPDDPENFGEPVKMDIAWKDDVLPGPDGKLQRGLGGRVHFLDKDGKPIRVHGSMTVYGFDEQNGKATSPRPDERFHFKDEQLQSVYSKSSIGHSYNIWLPWDEQGYQRHIAVLPIFRHPDGKLLKGEHSQAVLHGPENPNPVSHLQEKQRKFEESQMVERVVYQSSSLNSHVSQSNGELPMESVERVRTIGVPDSANAIRNSVQNGNTAPSQLPNMNPVSAKQLPNLSSNSPNDRPYEARPYQAEPRTAASASEAGANSDSNWDRAKDQFMKLGPRKNTGVPGSH
ncbi:MAG: hypothetical protein JNL67_02405 [Planctomycetaceae bacterium]|nr:hypothetical protein [Planctomycetaceae bacterium]